MSRLSRVLLGPFQRLGHAYNETAKRNPLSTGMITTVIKTSAADLFAQKVRCAAAERQRLTTAAI